MLCIYFNGILNAELHDMLTRSHGWLTRSGGGLVLTHTVRWRLSSGSHGQVRLSSGSHSQVAA